MVYESDISPFVYAALSLIECISAMLLQLSLKSICISLESEGSKEESWLVSSETRGRKWYFPDGHMNYPITLR